jgi:hypothetical protein
VLRWQMRLRIIRKEDVEERIGNEKFIIDMRNVVLIFWVTVVP